MGFRQKYQAVRRRVHATVPETTTERGEVISIRIQRPACQLEETRILSSAQEDESNLCHGDKMQLRVSRPLHYLPDAFPAAIVHPIPRHLQTIRGSDCGLPWLRLRRHSLRQYLMRGEGEDAFLRPLCSRHESSRYVRTDVNL